MVMGLGTFLVGFGAAPFVLSSAYVLPPGIRSSSFASTMTGVIGPVDACVGAPTRLVSESVSMSVDVGDGGQEQERNEVCSSGSREQFVVRVSAGVVAAAGAAAGGWVAPVAADSTGKYSSKATARKRYLPRIVKLVSAFQLLKKDIASGSANPRSDFFVDLLPDSLSAMDLYGSSMKKGETPDSKSRALQQLAQDFGSQVNSIAKSLGKKGGEADASASYDKAAVILAQYLKGVELDPLGSEAYN
eukprot:g14846.t1